MDPCSYIKCSYKEMLTLGCLLYNNHAERAQAYNVSNTSKWKQALIKQFIVNHILYCNGLVFNCL